MRSLKTFVLHLYFDPDLPERFCGDVNPLEEANKYPFKNQTELEILLLKLLGKPQKKQAIPSKAESQGDG